MLHKVFAVSNSKSESKDVTAMHTKKCRLWPAYVILGVQAVAIGLTVTPEISNLTRFIYMILGPLACVLLFLVWLLFASRLRWQERVAISLGVAVLGCTAALVVHASMAVTLWIYGVPLAMLFVTIAETLGKSWKLRPRMASQSGYAIW
jgi:hypothetical protein